MGTWYSSDKKITAVDENGNVTAVAVGTATITFVSSNNREAVCTVTVTDATSENPGGNGGSSGGSSGSTGGGASSAGTTTKNPDGSTTTVTTDKNGTVTEKTTYPDGSSKRVETKKDGTVTTTETRKDGVKSTTVTEPNGSTKSNITVPDQADRTTVYIPVDLGSSDGKVSISVTYPNGKTETQAVIYSNGVVCVTVHESVVIEILDDFVPLAAIDLPFLDIDPNAYYAIPVAWAVENGITAGTSATTFGPDSPCTRGQIMTFLWRAADSPTTNGSTFFDDVNFGSYYAQAVQWAAARGITSGTSAATFSPDTTCTRAQAVAFLYQAAGSPAVSGTNDFVDVDANAYYARAVQWALENGVTSGTSTTTFSPDSRCTRAQIVTFLYHAYNTNWFTT